MAEEKLIGIRLAQEKFIELRLLASSFPDYEKYQWLHIYETAFKKYDHNCKPTNVDYLSDYKVDVELAYEYFHNCWGIAKDNTGYVKDDWSTVYVGVQLYINQEPFVI